MSLDEWAMYHEVQAIKRQSSKSGKCAEKVNVLIWGDLSPREKNRNPNREIGLRRQESADTIIPRPSTWEGHAPRDKEDET